MNTHTSDSRQTLPVRCDPVKLKLTLHPAGNIESAVKPTPTERPRNIPEDALLARPLTAAECYGCVDWFPY
jgi:hypothetical protein